jgi:hypothetical protein
MQLLQIVMMAAPIITTTMRIIRAMISDTAVPSDDADHREMLARAADPNGRRPRPRIGAVRRLFRR